MSLLTIRNDGQRILATNFWDSEHAAAGLFYLSWNASAGRLLVPDRQTATLADMRSAECVVVSRGPWPQAGKTEALELLFEDRSDSPFTIHLGAEQTDRLIPDFQQGGGFVVAVWTRAGEQMRLPGKYRRVARLPCLDAWSEQ